MRTPTGIAARTVTEYNRLYMSAKRARWRLEGACSLCGRAPRSAMKTCQACGDRCGAANRRMDARRRSVEGML